MTVEVATSALPRSSNRSISFSVSVEEVVLPASLNAEMSVRFAITKSGIPPTSGNVKASRPQVADSKRYRQNRAVEKQSRRLFICVRVREGY